MHQGNVLKNLIKEKGFTQEEFAGKLGISRNYLLVTLEKTAIHPKYLQRASEILNVNQNVFTKEEESLKSDYIVSEPAATYGNAQAIHVNFMWVPLVSEYVRAGYLTGFSDPEYMAELPHVPFVVDKEYKGRYVAFKVDGDSMNDDSIRGYATGDTVLGREVRQEYWKSKLHITKWDFIIVHKERGVVLKRIIEHDVTKGIIKLHSLNPHYEDYEVNLEDVEQLFNVVQVMRNK